MSLLPANVARFHFEASELVPEAFEVTRFKGVEGISRPYRFTIDLVSQDPAIDFDRVLFKPATFIMMRGVFPVKIHGEVADIQQFGRISGHAAYRVLLVPRLWRLTRTFQSFIHQNRTLEAIIRHVLDEHEITDVRFALNGRDAHAGYDPYPARDYCVQYNETDFDFVSRLMEKEGVYYYFEQGADRETLVITDDRSTLQAIDEPASILYNEGEGLLPDVLESVQRFVCRRQAAGPEWVRLRDYNYETPDSLVSGTASPAQRADNHGFHFEYGEDHLATTDQAMARSQRRMEELTHSRHTFRGASSCAAFRSGYRFTLAAHYRPNFNADYLLTAVTHRGEQRQAMGLAVSPEHQTETGVLYRNTFHARPAGVPYRPPRVTPVPKVAGLMVAHVDHPDRQHDDHGHTDAYAHLDDQGRYKATLQFDTHREQPPAEHSLPIHVAQHYAGPDYGTHFPLHGGVEVLLACVNGDPDRPYIVGTVPNPNHTSPVRAQNKTQNIVRTFSGNEMLMEDQEGITKISLTSSGEHNAVLDDGGQHIGLTTSGGHTLRMHDAQREVHVRTTEGHHLVMQDADAYIQAQTQNQHVFRMDDTKKLIGLHTTDGHQVLLHDAEEYIEARTKDGHILRLDDADKKAGMVSKDGHRFLLDDQEKEIRLQTSDDHALIMTDDAHVQLRSKNLHRLHLDDNENRVVLQTGNENEVIALNESDGIWLESHDQGIHLVATTEIKLEVGGNSITINQNGIAINGTTLTEITGQLVTIN